MTSRLENYGLIGDGQSAALVGKNGSIDWLCLPRFDSDACLASLLGSEENGRWLIAPRGRHQCTARRYRTDTLTIETEFRVDGGAIRLVDFMPIHKGQPSLVRQVVGLGGEVPVHMELALRFAHGFVPPSMEIDGRRAVGRVGPDLVVLYADVPLELRGFDPIGEFTVREGDSVSFVLHAGDSTAPPPPPFDAELAASDTDDHWRRWIGRFNKPTDWPEAVKRSLITVKALTSQQTGGILAAPTCSLPEVPGSRMNWDYRYCWLRDAAFSLVALLNAGYHEEAEAWRDWILRAIAGSPGHMQIMYRLDGGRDLAEWTADWLEGYDWSTPVRVGNAAARQRQIDVFGELLDIFDLAERTGMDETPQTRGIERAIVDHLETGWRERGHGIWESRGEPRHYVYSKVMAWVAVDRFRRRNESTVGVDNDERRRLAGLAQRIHREVCDEGFHTGLGSFVQYYGGDEIDASLLLIPAVGFLPANHPRMVGTVARIEKELVEDGLVYRDSQARRSGTGAFLACSCWLADCYAAQGRERDARTTFERLLSLSGELGLLSEEYSIRAGKLCGNYPQGLSHLAVVTTGIGLCGPVLQRGGG